jgi:Tfp pilus assembly protein PilX
MSFKLNPPTIKELGNLVKTCHKNRAGAVLATALVVLVVLAVGVSVAIARSGFQG